eukprot:Gb_07996 [translate_table: standard]
MAKERGGPSQPTNGAHGESWVSWYIVDYLRMWEWWSLRPNEHPIKDALRKAWLEGGHLMHKESFGLEKIFIAQEERFKNKVIVKLSETSNPRRKVLLVKFFFITIPVVLMFYALGSSSDRDGHLLAVASSYTFEEGDKPHEPDAIFVRSANEVGGSLCNWAHSVGGAFKKCRISGRVRHQMRLMLVGQLPTSNAPNVSWTGTQVREDNGGIHKRRRGFLLIKKGVLKEEGVGSYESKDAMIFPLGWSHTSKGICYFERSLRGMTSIGLLLGELLQGEVEMQATHQSTVRDFKMGEMSREELDEKEAPLP